jgi:hypothetical protein
MYHEFSIADTIKASWHVLKKNFVPLVVYSFISLFINELLEFFKDFIFISDDRISDIIIWLIQMAVQAFLTLSFYKLILTLIDKEYYEFSFRDILPSFRMVFNFVLIAVTYMFLIAIFVLVDLLFERAFSDYNLLLTLFKIIEICLLIYLLLRSVFCICFIVDDDSSPIESLKQSFGITKDNFFKTLAMLAIIITFMIVALVPIFVIFILCGVNQESSPFAQKLMFYCWFLLSFPVVQVIIIETYRKLVYSHQDLDDDVSETI